MMRELKIPFTAEVKDILDNACRDALMKYMNEPLILMAHSTPRPWWKRSRLLHPIRTFKDWLHRDCGDY